MSHKEALFKDGTKFGEWSIENTIDSGGFGKVYKVVNKSGQKAALKVEGYDEEGISAIKMEIAILRLLNKDGERPHIPKVFHSAKRKKYCYMVMSLLGANIKELKKDNKMQTFSTSTWVRLGIQALYALKTLHDNGFVHRDIKPANFVIGDANDPEKKRMLFVIDFGLSRSYAFKTSEGKWIVRVARKIVDLRGTIRYCSPNVHREKEQGRADDLWSLMYVLIECHCGLPWQKENDNEKMQTEKLNISDVDLAMKMPQELHGIIPALRNLTCYQRPDYAEFHKCLLKIMERKKYKFDDPFDWEKAGVTKPKTTPKWYDAADFFKSDPIGINGLPSATDRKAKEKKTKEITYEQTTEAVTVDKTYREEGMVNADGELAKEPKKAKGKKVEKTNEENDDKKSESKKSDVKEESKKDNK